MVRVIFNPRAGKSRAKRRLPAWLTEQPGVELLPTDGPGHALTLALEAANGGCDIVAAAGGDGTVHEVANGILLSGREDVTLAVVPIGSANDFAFSLERQFGTLSLLDDRFHQIDVGLVDAGSRHRYFVESVGLGLSARVTLESRQIHRLQGLLLYGLAALRALSAHRPQPLKLGWDDEPASVETTLMLSMMLGRREGNFLLAPKASMDDGLFDAVHALEIGRWQAMRLLPRLAKTGPPENHPQIKLRQCRSLSISAPSPLTIHTDGEMFCTPNEGITSAAITLLPKRLRAKVCVG
jgi:diacylglycerol kinase family enzyme